jgi:anti-sigma regulatory factor (Ser/Thr protein kinase)
MSGDEQARLAALKRYKILDTEPERGFDDLTMLASHICETPVALITLLDADRQWFKARVGVTVHEWARSVSFCTHAIKQRDLYVVPDATRHELFRENPYVVGEPCIRFYAGAPLVTPDGHALGTICVLDLVPRTLTADQTEALDALRRQAQAQLELRLNLMQLRAALGEREQAEAGQIKLIGDLRTALDEVKRLSALVPFCSTCQFDMIIPANPSSIPTITDGVLHLLHNMKWPEDEIIKVELALQEALANAIRHGCQGDASKHVECCVTVDPGGEIMIVVRDPGTGFDEKQLPHPLRPENMLKPSGRGVYLINELMDEVAYADGGRELQMRKRREVVPPAGVTLPPAEPAGATLPATEPVSAKSSSP